MASKTPTRRSAQRAVDNRLKRHCYDSQPAKHQSLSIPTAKAQMSVWDYEAMPNGNKHNVLTRYPIHDLFVPVIDHKLRNGIGHHSAVYAAATDEVIYYRQEGEQLQENRLAYAAFVFKVLEIFSAVELAALYFHPLHVKALDAV